MNIKLSRAMPDVKKVFTVEPKTVEEQIEVLKSQVKAIQQAFLVTRKALIASKAGNRNAYDTEKPERTVTIPPGTALIGITKGIPYILSVDSKGRYKVGGTTFKSLSAAAQAVSGNQRSGWVFWKTPDGITAKEAFGKTHGKKQEET